MVEPSWQQRAAALSAAIEGRRDRRAEFIAAATDQRVGRYMNDRADRAAYIAAEVASCPQDAIGDWYMRFWGSAPTVPPRNRLLEMMRHRRSAVSVD